MTPSRSSPPQEREIYERDIPKLLDAGKTIIFCYDTGPFSGPSREHVIRNKEDWDKCPSINVRGEFYLHED